MSRHTKLDKPISRSVLTSIPGDKNNELVVYLAPGGSLRLVAEPTDRRIKRNEELPTVEVDMLKLFTNGNTKTAEPDGADGISGVIKDHVNSILTQVAVHFPHDTKEFYKAKCVLLKAIKDTLQPDPNIFDD